MEILIFSLKFKIFMAVSAIFFPFLTMLFCAAVIIKYSSLSVKYLNLYCLKLNIFNDAINQIVIKIKESVNQNFFAIFNDRASVLLDIKSKYEIYQSVVQTYSFYFLICAVIFIVFYHKDRKDLINRTIAAASVFLAVGIFSPFIFFKASNFFPFLGETIFKFKAKGILSTIQSLFDSGNIPIGILIIIFSIIIPAAKLIVSIFAYNAYSSTHTYAAILKFIGKWSMTDVFTVSILLAYLALDSSDSTSQAWLGHGFYFFAGYCLITLITSKEIIREVESNNN